MLSFKYSKIWLCAILTIAAFLSSYLLDSSSHIIFALIFTSLFLFLFLVNIKFGIYILFFVSIYWHALLPYQVNYGGINVDLPDALILILLVAFILKSVIKKAPVIPTTLGKYFYLMLFVLILPIFVGFIHKHNILTIFRDARPVLYFMLAIPTMAIITDGKELKRLFRFIFILTIFALVFYYLTRFLQLPFRPTLSKVPLTSGESYCGYGFFSAYDYYALFSFIMISYILFQNKKFLQKCRTIIVISLLLFPIVFLLGRGLLFSTLVGTFFIYLAFLREQKLRGVYTTFRIGVFVILGVIVLMMMPKEQIKNNPLIERYGSFFNPSLSSVAARASIEYRLTGLTYFKQKENNNIWLGKGYGEAGVTLWELSESEEIVFKLGYLGHSGYGWAFYRLGVFPSIIFFLTFAFIVFRLISKIRHITNIKIKSIYYGISILLFCSLLYSFGVAVLFTESHYMIMVGVFFGILLNIDKIADEK